MPVASATGTDVPATPRGAERDGRSDHPQEKTAKTPGLFPAVDGQPIIIPDNFFLSFCYPRPWTAPAVVVCGDPASDGGMVGTPNYGGIPLG